MIKLKDILNEASLPTKIGFGKGKPDFKHGFIKEFFEFFYLPGGSGQPIGNFKEMADGVHDRAYGLDDMLGEIGSKAQEIYDYLQPPGGEEHSYDLHQMTQKGSAQAIYSYMKNVNKLAKTIEDSVKRGGAAEEPKVKQGLKGVLGMLEKAKNIFTSSFGPPKKRRRIGFKF